MIMDTDSNSGISAFQSSGAETAVETLTGNVASMADGAARAGHGVPGLAQHSGLRTQRSSLSFAPPLRDAEFARLPDSVREQLSRTLRSLAVIHNAPNKTQACRVQAASYHGARGFSQQSLERKYYAYRDAGGDWRALIDRAKAGPAHWNCGEQAGLPEAFIQFWKKLAENNQRKAKPAWRELMRAWRTREITDPTTGKRVKLKAIPGYAEWPQANSLDGRSPKGWSYANLERHLEKFELAAARLGRDKASDYTRKVFTTRAGLRVGQFYLFDDQEYDVFVNFPGAPRAMRPVGLNVLDLFSACCVAYGFKPVLIDDGGVKKKGLEKHMPFLLAHVLCSRGYRTDAVGTTLIVESGTATIREEMAERIASLTEGKVIVHKGRTKDTPSFPGLFEGASKGNPRFKAALESFFNLVRNEMAMLPGQSGLDRDHSPAEHYGRDRYNTKLLKIAEQLPPHRRELLKMPFMDWTTFVDAALRVYSEINARTEHDLEGWQKAGLVIQDMYLSLPSAGSVSSVPSVVNPQPSTVPVTREQWNAMTKAQQDALRPMLHSFPRNLSPQEVWTTGATELQALGNHALPVLLGPDFGVERTVRGGYITIEDQELGPEPLRFPSSDRLLLNNGDKYLCYLNPFDPSTLVLTDARGRYLGDLTLQTAPSRADVESVKRQIGAAKAEEAKRLGPVAARHIDHAQAKRDMHRHNTAVLKGKAITLEERQDAAEIADRVRKDGAAALDAILDCQPQEASMADGPATVGAAASDLDDIL